MESEASCRVFTFHFAIRYSLPFSNRLFENVERPRHLLAGDGERWREREHIAHRRLEGEASIEGAVEHGLGKLRIGLFRVAALHELDAEEEAAAAHISDRGKPALHRVKAFERQPRRRFAAFSTRPSSSMISIVVSAARAVTGFFSCV